MAFEIHSEVCFDIRLMIKFTKIALLDLRELTSPFLNAAWSNGLQNKYLNVSGYQNHTYDNFKLLSFKTKKLLLFRVKESLSLNLTVSLWEPHRVQLIILFLPRKIFCINQKLQNYNHSFEFKTRGVVGS